MSVKTSTVRSACGLCSAACGLLLHVENGRLVRIEGDAASPVNRGRLCAKASASLEFVYHSERLRHPLKRLGKRGDGKWQQITWDEALDTIAEQFTGVKNNYGAEALAFHRGSFKGLPDGYIVRFANAFGSPNLVSVGHVCHLPQTLASRVTCGFVPTPDYEHPPACIVLWGCNPVETAPARHLRITDALDSGTKLIVVDPRGIHLTEKADLWLKLRPGSDLALALGLIYVIINEGLYNKSFVEHWTVGFDKLRDYIQDYSSEKMAEITWVSENNIRETARLYARNKPAVIEIGNATDHTMNSMQASRALCILRAITGNFCIPGGELNWARPPVIDSRSPQLELREQMPPEKWNNRLDAEYKMIPLLRQVLPQNYVKAVLENNPYPVRASYVQGTNPLMAYSNARQTYEAFMKLDFSVVADFFMTPTAALADIVLPVASYLEYNSIAEASLPPLMCCQQKVFELDECWSDYKILSELARRLNLGESFWDTEEECLDALLNPTGITFEEFKKIGWISGNKQYRDYERDGFATPSGKVEIFSERFKLWNFDPLPVYCESPETPYSEPELANEYPLILTSSKSAPYRHSTGRQIKSLRNSHPEPVVHIHPDTAKKLGIQEDSWVYIETRRGSIRQKVAFDGSIDPRVVVVDYGWWFPERNESYLYDWAESNINILTDNKLPYSREVGSANLRGLFCKIRKA